MAQEMPQQPQAPQEQGSGNLVQQLVLQINKMLSQLGQVVQQSGVVDDSGLQKFAGVLNGFQDFVENDLGAPADQQKEMPMKGNAPMETMGKPAKQAL